MNLFQYKSENKRYYTLDNFYKHTFGEKVFKVSLNAGFTCPNIDGTVGRGGCIYCSPSGSGDFAGNLKDGLVKQFNSVKEVLHKKWPNAKYIGYFQAHTNTYAPLEILKSYYETILNQPNVVGLAIATRPDAITDECMNYLEALSKKTFLTIELGLQTIHAETSNLINRCHDLDTFHSCVIELRKRNINVVVHIINGLPYETKTMMYETVKYLNKLDIQGIKIHMLHILKHTKLGILYKKNPFPVLSKEDYIQIVCNQLELLRPEIVIHRITGDPDPIELIEPSWLTKKFGVLNAIDQELEKRKTYQGFQLSIEHPLKRLIAIILRESDVVLNQNELYEGFIKTITKKESLTAINNSYFGKLSLILLMNKNYKEYLPYLNKKGMILILSNEKQDLTEIGYDITCYHTEDINYLYCIQKKQKASVN